LAYVLHKLKLRRFFSSLIILIAFLSLSLVVSVSVGSTYIPLNEVYACITGLDCSSNVRYVLQYRLVRTLVALLAGGALATAGVIMQGIARNPLAEPYILGLSSTALTALSLAIIIDVNVIAHRYLFMLIAFIGALFGYFLTSILSALAGYTSNSLILSGIAVTAFFSGTSHALLYIVQDRLKFPYVHLLMGSTSVALFNDIYYLTATLAACLVITYICGIPKLLNAYLVGDDYARQLGYNLKVLITLAAFVVSILTGATVAIVGIVSFIGLAAPHISRMMLGTSDHRITTIVSSIVGSLLVVIADIGSRLLMVLTARGEFPLGVVTSIIGAPFLAYLIIVGGRK